MRPIVWLASFPKSGNTWLRLLLSNLSADEPCGINDLGGRDGMASGRKRFDDTCLIASGLLTLEECDRMRPAVYRHIARNRAVGVAGKDGVLDAWQWIKTHDAWTNTSTGEPLLGGGHVARAAVLIVRDPRDVVASLANHNGQGLAEAAALMGNPNSAFSDKIDRQPLQLRQRLLGWSGFYGSWMDQREVPVHVLRYEDMQVDTAGVLGTLLADLGLAVDSALLACASERSVFARVQAQEAEGGFLEAPMRMTTGRFFRCGRSGGWREELDEALRERIESDHGAMMRRFGYLPDGGG